MCIYIYIEKTNYILCINYILCMAMYILRCVCVCVCVSLAPNIVIEMLSSTGFPLSGNFFTVHTCFFVSLESVILYFAHFSVFHL